MTVKHVFISTAAVALLFMSGCMGTFQTARVAPLRVGGFYFTSVGSDESNHFTMPGVIIEGGWPAGLNRFGIGLNVRLIGVIEDDGDIGFFPVWGGKLQLPQNSVVDVAVGLDVWAYYPGEVKLLLSRQLGIFEPYTCLSAVNFLNSDNDINLFDDGSLSYTIGMMIELGSTSGWMMAVELEGGNVWKSPGIGLAVLKEF